MRSILIVLIFFVSANFCRSNEIIDKYEISSTGEAELIEAHNKDTVYSSNVSGELEYLNGKLSSGTILFYIDTEKLKLVKNSEAETYLPTGDCLKNDTLVISFTKTFQNPRSNAEEPNYTIVSQICLNEYGSSLVFPAYIELTESTAEFSSRFTINFQKLYCSFGNFDPPVSELILALKFSAVVAKDINPHKD